MLEGELRCDAGEEDALASATEEIEAGGDVELHRLGFPTRGKWRPVRLAHHGHLDRSQVAFLVTPSFLRP